MSTKKAQAPADGATDTGTKKKPVMLIAIVGVFLLAVVGTFLVTKQVAAKGKASVEKKIVEHGPVMNLDEFLVNLSDSGGDHFLKVSIGIELDKSKGATEETMKEKIAPIRDAVLTSLSSKSRDDVSTTKGREKLKNEIKTRINDALGDDDVQGIYFTNFVTQ